MGSIPLGLWRGEPLAKRLRSRCQCISQAHFDSRTELPIAVQSQAPGAVAGFPYRFVFEILGPIWSEADLHRYIAFHARLGVWERADLIAFLEAALQ